MKYYDPTKLNDYFDPTRPNGLESLNSGIDLYKERCARIKAENELKELKELHKKEIANLEYDIWKAKRNWWKRFRLPKLIWRDEYDE